MLFSRLHHAMADGMALAQVMMSLTDPAPDAHEPDPVPGPASRGTVEGLVATATGLVRSTLSLPAAVPLTAFKALGVTRKLLLDVLPSTLLSHEPGVEKLLSWSHPQPLGVCILSYADTVRIGFKVDAATVPVPDQLVAFFEAELDSLRAAAVPV